MLIVFCKIDKLTLLNIKLINTLSTFRRYQDSRERGKGDWHRLFTKIHFDIDCLYHRQGNKQKQVAINQFKIPINQDTKFIKKISFNFKIFISFQTGFPHLFGVEDPVKMSLSFFGPDINRMNRPPNNFLPNPKNWRVDGEYLISTWFIFVKPFYNVQKQLKCNVIQREFSILY